MAENDKVNEKETPEEVEDEPVEVEAEVTPMTAKEFSTKMDELFVKAKAASISPIKVLAATYLRQGFDVIDGLLGGLSGDDPKKPPKE